MNNLFKTVLLILLFTVCSTATGQDKGTALIKGTVEDYETGEMLIGASVYFEGTTIGTTAGLKGDFTLTVSQKGNYELVVSMVGYLPQKLGYYIELGKTYNLKVKLKQNAINMAAVEIKGEDQGEWKRDIGIFTRKFLGTMKPASECVIENKEYINFINRGDTITASSSKPVVVVNNYLGYRVVCEIISYKYDPVSTYQAYSFFSRFEEMKPKDDAEKEKWIKNREQIFLGSPVHFLWALRNNRLNEEGFRVFPQSGSIANRLFAGNEIKSLDELKYGEQIFEEPAVSFKNVLRIEYKGGDKSYIEPRYPFFTIDASGIADNHLPFISYGYWAGWGVANMLPRGYLPASLK